MNKEQLLHCWCVLKITKKPNKVEYKTIVKASGLGICVIGIMGFILSFLKQIISQ